MSAMGDGSISDGPLQHLRRDPAVLSVLAVFDDIRLRSKSNHRHRSSSSSWAGFSSFEDVVGATARANRPDSWPVVDPDVKLADRPVVAVSVVASTLVDAANVPKSITDALEGVCYVSDASARAVSSLTVRSRTPGFAVVAAACLPTVSLLELSRVSQLTVAAAYDEFTFHAPHLA